MCALPHGGQLTSAAIVGQDGGVWAQSAGFPAITKAEVDAIMAGLGDAAAIAATGIVIGGQKARWEHRSTESVSTRSASGEARTFHRALRPRPCNALRAVPVDWGRARGRAPREEEH